MTLTIAAGIPCIPLLFETPSPFPPQRAFPCPVLRLASQDNLYGTTIESIAGPAREGNLVLMQCHPPAIRRLQLLGDVHPVVIFVEPSAARASDKSDAEAQKLLQEKLEFGHCYTHVIPEAPLHELALRVADIVNNEARAKGMWANIPALLPRYKASAATVEPIAEVKTPEKKKAAGETATTATATTQPLSVYSQSTPLKCTFETVVVKRVGKHKFGFSLRHDAGTGVPTVVVEAGVRYAAGVLRNGARVLSVDGTNVVCEPASKVCTSCRFLSFVCVCVFVCVRARVCVCCLSLQSCCYIPPPSSLNLSLPNILGVWCVVAQQFFS